MRAHEYLEQAARLVAGDRQSQHGDKRENFQNIADLWSAYLGAHITAEDVPLMMSLMKIARTKTGSHNPDDYLDGAGYLGCAGEVADGK